MTLLQECIAALRARDDVVVLRPNLEMPNYDILGVPGRIAKLTLEPWRFHLLCVQVHDRTPHRCEVTG